MSATVLTEDEWRASAEPVRDRMLVRDRPPIFTDALPHRMLLFPWYDPPSTAVVAAVAAAARTLEDEALYREDFLKLDEAAFAFVPLDDLDGFHRTLPEAYSPLTLFSYSGRWAIFTTDFWEAFVGAADPAFLEVLCTELPRDDASPVFAASGPRGRWRQDDPLPPERQVIAWLSHDRWLSRAEEDSRRKLLVHLYGARRADDLLAEAAPAGIRIE